ncbi:ATP-binding cassette glutathione S-conjugate transporter ycf1 [Friedmanniomyces endolithicus]|nr:ATP-binding cassette glutathione S-conjugate transporter ycf1 [Friedmanniomyces endolithicus]KAK0966877.1 ATP-binding cassette glutathione S-conjugate transporter ycf1 [Friedmanniomyces endolithicus]KAK1036510.1 ATP-binding cassette glutathione S-conjugate transporter ycf1 [Friedmanniomyces endolithicus]
MVDFSSPQIVIHPYHVPTYLSATQHFKQPLCGNSEGWGPLSPHRWDFTPCFQDVWIAAVSVWGILGGAAAIWYLHKRCTPEPVAKNWHFYAKLAVIGVLMATTVVQAGLQIERFSGWIWAGDFRFWTTVLNLLSLGSIFYVQYLEHWRSRTPSAVALLYWLFLLIVYGIKLRSLVSQGLYHHHVAYFAVFTASVALALSELVLEWLVPKKLSAYDALGDEDECPVEYANIFSRLTFGWMTPMMRYGYKEFLTQDDLWNLRKRDTTHSTSGVFEEMWNDELEKKKPSLWIALFRSFGGPYFRGAVIKTFSDCLAFVQPQLLRLLISFVDSYRSGMTPQPPIKGAAIALAMFAVSVGQTAFLHQYFQRSFETGMRVKSALTATIYQKSLRLSNEGRAARSTGDIVNYMAVDTQRLQDLAQYGQQLWSAPFQITLCLISLYQLLGISMLAGLAAMLAMIPINGVIARVSKTLQKRQMKNKDARTRLMTEILNNMKSIKLYAWTTAFMNKLNFIRNDQELHTLRKIGAVTAVANFTWSTTPFLVSCSTFAVFVATQNRPLNTEIVFPALTLFNLLTFPLAVLPMVITAIIEASVAVTRLTDFFTSSELQPDGVLRSESVGAGEESVRIRDATFTWNKDEGRNVLHDIHLSAHKGELQCVVGRVGAGKSSLLGTMLGDLYKIKGEVVMRGTSAYVSQSPWIMNASVRENIVFGYRWDPAFYDRTIKACALIEDFASLPDGDQTEVGERGISLSGGQKARVTLARAVYARADIYMLDDVLSAVDQHVGRHLIDNVLGPKGLLAGKTRVLATNSIPVLMEANYILLLRDGRIIERGTYEQLVAMKGEIAQLIRTSTSEDSSQDVSEASSDSPLSEAETQYSPEDILEAEEAQEGLTQLAPIKPGGGGPVRRANSSTTLRRASTASFRGPRGKMTDEEESKGNLKSKQTKEFSEKGKVKRDVYAEYAKESNLGAVAVYMVMLIGAQTASIGGNFWLKYWSEANTEAGGNPHVGKYLGVYLAFGIGSAALVVVQTLILWIFCSIEASRKLHERMGEFPNLRVAGSSLTRSAYAIFRSPMSFFETTPTGRILNRFSRYVTPPCIISAFLETHS